MDPELEKRLSEIRDTLDDLDDRQDAILSTSWKVRRDLAELDASSDLRVTGAITLSIVAVLLAALAILFESVSHDLMVALRVPVILLACLIVGSMVLRFRRAERNRHEIHTGYKETLRRLRENRAARRR